MESGTHNLNEEQNKTTLSTNTDTHTENEQAELQEVNQSLHEEEVRLDEGASQSSESPQQLTSESEHTENPEEVDGTDIHIGEEGKVRNMTPIGLGMNYNYIRILE